MRLGEKKVLNFFIEFVDDVTPLLSFPKSDLEWVLRHCNRRNFTGAFDQYIRGVIEPLVAKYHSTTILHENKCI
jgi:hypothetical protein